MVLITFLEIDLFAAESYSAIYLPIADIVQSTLWANGLLGLLVIDVHLPISFMRALIYDLGQASKMIYRNNSKPMHGRCSGRVNRQL